MELARSIRFDSFICKVMVVALVNLSVSLSMLQAEELPCMTSDVNEVSGKYFDYIVVGGGTAGCALAATLSEKFSVLVVERGGSPYGNPLTLQRNAGLSQLLTDEYTSIAQSFVSKEGVSNARGRVLGGSSVINIGFYSRASEAFIADAGFDAELVEEAYEWVESKIAYKQDNKLLKFQKDFLSGLEEAGVLPFNGFTWEHIVGAKIGASIFDKSGVRHSAADLLMAGNPQNLKVLLNATIKNIIFHKTGDQTVASGVRFIKSDGSTSHIYEAYISQGEVILSAGAIGSPQILLLSGIGPENHLQQHGIPVVLNLESVGAYMQDNPAIAFTKNNKPGDTTSGISQVAGIAKDFKFSTQGGNIFLTSVNETTTLTIIKVALAASRGKLELNNTDARQNPSVEFKYFTKGRDLDECVEMVRLLKNITSSRSLKGIFGSQPRGISVSDTEQVKEYCKQNVQTYNHYHGGCNIGRVVDADYKVYGVKGLRVVDGSTFWTAPGTNPMATVLMLGRYQGIKILRERESYSVAETRLIQGQQLCMFQSSRDRSCVPSFPVEGEQWWWPAVM